MSYGFFKQSSSRPLPGAYQVVQLTQGAATASTNFKAGTQQIRVASQINCWATINQTTSDSVSASSSGGVGMILSGGTTSSLPTVYTQTFAEYFTVTPGQLLIVASTSTSSFAVSVTEMS